MNRRPELDVVIASPGARTRLYQSLGRTLTGVEPPVWAGLMASFARGRGCSVAIVDAEADELEPAAAATRILEARPRLVAIAVYGHQPSASTQNMTGTSAMARAVKELAPDLPVLLVGGHVAALPEQTLQEEACDYAAWDEGLHAIVGLVEMLRTGGSEVSRIPGLVYRVGDAIVRNPAAPLVQDLDREMPGLAWDLLPMARYRAHNWHCFGDLPRQPYAALYTSLGCPYKCTFCCIQAPFKAGERQLGLSERVNSYRTWSAAAVTAQLDRLVGTYDVRNVKIADEMFVLHPRHVHAICDAIIERGYDLNIWAYARVDTVRDGMLEKLKRAGVNWLAFGIEAAAAHVRNEVDKRFDQDDVYRTIGQVREAGINVIGNYIFGLPEDDRQSMQATLDLALELNCEFANFYSTMAYPGSPLHADARRRGWTLPSAWSGYSQHAVDTLPLPTRHLTAAEVLRFRDEAFTAYFTDPRYLAMIERRFGAATVAQIRDMTSHTLERQYA
jgi:anaerobic magnesium-protoporphyrin IX monomethyl ester cyclase